MDALGGKAQTRSISKAGFNYFSQLSDASETRGVLFCGRGAAWQGRRAPIGWPLGAAVVREPPGEHHWSDGETWRERRTGVRALLTREAASSREEVVCTGCPAGRTLWEWEGSKCQAACCSRDLKGREREAEAERRGRRRRVSPSVLRWAAASGCCPSCCCRCRGVCHQVRLPPALGIASCGIASGDAHRHPYMINKVLPGVLRSPARLHTDLASELGAGAGLGFGKLP